MKKCFLLLPLLLLMITACGDDDKRDLCYPTISSVEIEACPVNCQQFFLGEVIKFHYGFHDDVELGNFSIEIQNNFDHHAHSTSTVVCENDPDKAPVAPWVYNKSFDIPSGRYDYDAQVDIPIPTNIDPGDYVFTLRLNDAAGWQEQRVFLIKIME